MTLLTPFLLALVFVVPGLMMSNQDKDFKKIAVVGDSDLYQDVIPDTKEADFEFLPNTSVNDIKNNFSEKGYYGVLYISDLLVDVPNAVQLISKQQPPIGLLDHITGSLKKELEKKKLHVVQYRKPRCDTQKHQCKRRFTDHKD